MRSPARDVRAVLDREHALLDRLGRLLETAEAPPETRRRLADLADGLGELFLLVVVGEFNAGKSTLVNALFGQRVMEEGPVPTTDKITVLRHGGAGEAYRRAEQVTERRLDHPLLERLALVDTPGTNSIVREHQALTEDFVPRADLVLFVTSYDRPLSESERVFLGYVRGAWRKQLVVAVNKADLAESEAALEQVLAHVRDGLRTVLGAGEAAGDPPVFPVAARLALAARLEAAPGAGAESDPRWTASRFEPFERYLTEALTDEARLALKLAGPLDAAEALLADARTRLANARTAVAADAAGLADLDAGFGGARADLDETAARATAEVDRELLEMQLRGGRFLDDTIRISKLNLLRDRAAFRDAFAREVTRDAETRIEARLGEAADRLLRRTYDLWNETYARLADLQKARDGAARAGFTYDREEVLRDVLREARSRIDATDLDAEARRLLENARAGVAVGGIAAAGIGAGAAVLIAATAFDLTGGLIAAGAAATLGFVVLPRQRRRAIRDFEASVEALRASLRDALERAFTAEAEAGLARVRRLVEPVEALVVAESGRLDAADAEALDVEAEARALRAAIGA